MSGQRPSEAELSCWVAAVRPVVLAHSRTRRWWRRLSRPAVVASVVGAVAAGGIAYAAVDRGRTFTPDAPTSHTGNTIIDVGKPGPGDKWLNVSFTYRCEPGQSFTLLSGRRESFSRRCGTGSYAAQVAKMKREAKGNPGAGGFFAGGAGISGSVPVAEVIGHQVAVISDLSRDYLLTASWGPRPVTPAMEMLPPLDEDGNLAWSLPTYQVNEYGLTVSDDGIRIDLPRSAYPDLLSTTFRGRKEYIRTDETFARQDAGTPEEAKRQEELRRRRGLVDENGDSCHFLYKADGKTRVGRYCPARDNRRARQREARQEAERRPG